MKHNEELHAAVESIKKEIAGGRRMEANTLFEELDGENEELRKAVADMECEYPCIRELLTTKIVALKTLNAIIDSGDSIMCLSILAHLVTKYAEERTDLHAALCYHIFALGWEVAKEQKNEDRD